MSTVRVVRLLAVCVSLALGGCTALYVGGATDTGYSESGGGEAAEAVARDAEVARAVAARLAREPSVPVVDVRVDVREGVAVLDGSVPSAGARRRAVVVARGVEGVKRVVSRLRVAVPD